MNNWNGMGRLTADPDVRTTSNDMKVARYTLAVDRRGKEGADFIRCTAFGKTAEWVERYLAKGIKIAVTGSIHTDSYKDRDGRTIYTTEIYAQDHEFCEPRAKAADGPVNAPNDFRQAIPREDVGAGFMAATGDDGVPFN